MYLSLDKIKEILLEKGEFRLVFLGDSCTSLEWVHPNWREMVEYTLKMELDTLMGDWKIPSWGVRCINAGFDGSGTQDLLNLLDRGVFSYQPDMVIYADSSNDHHFEIGPEGHKDNTKKLLKKLWEKVPYVVYTSSTATSREDYNKEYASYVEKSKELLPMDGVGFVDVFEEFLKFDLAKLYTLKNRYGNEAVNIKPGGADFAHPNQLGNAYVAKIILGQVFGVKFDPDKYIEETISGEMYPGY